MGSFPLGHRGTDAAAAQLSDPGAAVSRDHKPTPMRWPKTIKDSSSFAPIFLAQAAKYVEYPIKQR
jgi:hypothetical protein